MAVVRRTTAYIKWFFPGGDVDTQLSAIENARQGAGSEALYHLRAWPLLWATILTTGLAVLFGLVLSMLAAIFIVEFAPRALRRVLDPVVRLLAGVPSVIYGLIGVLAIAPWVEEHLISEQRKESVAYVVQLTGTNLAVAVLILTVMITPIMVAISASALASVPSAWTEGSAALGVNRWRTIWRVSLRTARPAIIAGAVLATGRALGRGDHALDGRRRAQLRAQPARRPHRPVRAGPAAGGDDPHLLSTASPIPTSRTRCTRSARCCWSPAPSSRSPRWAAKQPLKRYGIRA